MVKNSFVPIVSNHVIMNHHGKNKKPFALEYILELNVFENVCAIGNVALSVPLKPLDSISFPVMKTSTILAGEPHKALGRIRFGQRVEAAKRCMRSWFTALLHPLGRWELGFSIPARKKKGNTMISNPKSHLPHSLGKMVWNELKLLLKVHTAL